MIGAARAVIEAKVELGKLDAAAGDGDLGGTLEKGFAAVVESLDADPSMDVPSQVRSAGQVLSTVAPSTMGTLLGFAWIAAADQLRPGDEFTADDAVRLLDATANAVAETGGAQTGQRTALDALVPSATAAADAAGAGMGIAAVLDRAAAAAASGAEATASMTPAVGRARWMAERATGVVDGGARAWAIWLRGFADALPPGSD